MSRARDRSERNWGHDNINDVGAGSGRDRGSRPYRDERPPRGVGGSWRGGDRRGPGSGGSDRRGGRPLQSIAVPMPLAKTDPVNREEV